MNTETPTHKQTRLYTWARESWVGKSVRSGRRFRREVWGWARCPQITGPGVKRLADSLAALTECASGGFAPESDPEAPIFLLSTGWRAGSTLLQRILVTDPSLLLWGEPLGEMSIVSRLSEMLSRSLSPWNLNSWKNPSALTPDSMATSWIANLYPPAEDFRSALRGLFDRWLAEPAHRNGFKRWGFKEVRLGATEALMLHWLYPRARFVVISRHPYDCYRSLADSGWPIYFSYPDVFVDSAALFARCWNRVAVSWSQLPTTFPCCFIRYDDLIRGGVNFRELESWLGIRLKEDVALSVSVGGTATGRRVSWFERRIIAREAQEGMRSLGYSPNTRYGGESRQARAAQPSEARPAPAER
jgi:Sulfotransferase family